MKLKMSSFLGTRLGCLRLRTHLSLPTVTLPIYCIYRFNIYLFIRALSKHIRFANFKRFRKCKKLKDEPNMNFTLSETHVSPICEFDIDVVKKNIGLHYLSILFLYTGMYNTCSILD